MDHNELRARIRQLIASGDLPPVHPLTDKTPPGQSVRVTRIVIGPSAREPCLICGEPDPLVSYTYADQRVIRLHADCDALWRQERQDYPPTP
jgi:hypothetical protein